MYNISYNLIHNIVKRVHKKVGTIMVIEIRLLLLQFLDKIFIYTCYAEFMNSAILRAYKYRLREIGNPEKLTIQEISKQCKT